MRDDDRGRRRRRTPYGAAGTGRSAAPDGRSCSHVLPTGGSRSPLAWIRYPGTGPARDRRSAARSDGTAGGSAGPPPAGTVGAMTTPRARATRPPSAPPPVGRSARCPTWSPWCAPSPRCCSAASRCAGRPRIMLALAYAVYWVGDIARRLAARRLDQETRAGAVLDIVSDRACTACCAPGSRRTCRARCRCAIVFLLSFMVLDTMLSLAFLCWPILEPQLLPPGRPASGSSTGRRRQGANTAGVVGAIALGGTPSALVVALVVGRRQGLVGGPRGRPARHAAVTGLLEPLLALVHGVASALLPLVNAEAYARGGGDPLAPWLSPWRSCWPSPSARPSASWCSSRPPAAGPAAVRAVLAAQRGWPGRALGGPGPR